MIGAALALLAQAAAPTAAQASQTAVAEQIVVIGKQLDSFKGGVYKKDGQLTCRIAKSTGDEEVDMIRCGAMLRCYAPHVDEFDAIAASDKSKAVRNTEMQAIAEQAKPCLAEATQAGTRMLATKRAAE